jgi:hypothetical protein
MFDLFRLSCCAVALATVGVVAVLASVAGSDQSLQGSVTQHWTCVGPNQWSSPATKVRRIEGRTHAVQSVIAGDATLFEAGAIFYRQNRELGGLAYREKPSGVSDEEWACRQVINWVRAHVTVETDCLAECLEEELRQHKEQHGKVILPEAE